MSNIELKRDHNAKLHCFVGGQPALGAIVAGVEWLGDKQVAKILIPLEHLTFGEVTTVVPMVRPVR